MYARRKQRDDIQGLRALAVLLVVFYHSGLSLLPGGYIGVDVFFVISGYLVAGPFVSDPDYLRTFNLWKFYARRARRLLPAASLVIFVTIIVFRQIYSPLEMKQFTSSAIASASYLSNIWFAQLETDYLGHNSDLNPLLHTWSLGVEEQFYLIWPCTVLLLHWLGSRRNASMLVVATVILTGLSFITCIWLSKIQQPWAFFLFFTRFWEFGIGALTAALVVRRKTITSCGGSSLVLIGIALIILPACYFSSLTLFPGYLASIPVAGTAALLIAIPNAAREISVIFTNRVSRFLGDISYSLYLWHWPVFVLLDELGWRTTLTTQSLGILASVCLATITYYGCENPIRFHRNLVNKTQRTLGFSILLVSLLIAAGFLSRQESKVGLNEPIQRALYEIKKQRPKVYEDGCHHQFLDTTLNDCDYGNVESDTSIVLFGDSHAAHWFPALEEIANTKGMHLISYTKSSCPSVMFEPYDHSYKRQYTECTEWRTRVLEKLKQIRPAIIIVSNSYGYLRSIEKGAETWQQSLDHLLAILTTFPDIEVKILHDIPFAPFDVPTCLARASWHQRNAAAACSFVYPENAQTRFIEVERHLADNLKRVTSIDAHRIVCPEYSCDVLDGNVVRYFDSNHLSASYSLRLAEKIEALIFR